MKYSELLKHGYSRGLTSTEYALRILEELSHSVDSEAHFLSTYFSLVNRVLRERPSNAASINALREIGLFVLERGFNGVDKLVEKLAENMVKACEDAAIIASHRVTDGDVLMTMSNSMCLRKMFEKLVERSVRFKVYVAESRPGMEGLELASFLDKLGVETYLIVDSAMRFFVKEVDKVFVSTEALAINGAIVSKVGTSLLALIASEARVRVYALAPLYKLSFQTLHGELLELPESDWRMLMSEDIRKTLPENYKARAPIYDVTPPSLIDGVVTEYGLFAPQAIPVVLKQVFGTFPVATISLNELVSKLKEKYGEGGART